MKPSPPAKLFTIEEANATLPLVSAITRDLMELSRDVVERRERLAILDVHRLGATEKDPYSAELEQIREELERDSKRLQGYVEELRQIGVLPKSGPDGLVDFPAEIDGRLVHLCWKFGEPEVSYWHEVDAGTSSRKPFSPVEIGEGGEPGGSDGA